MVETSKKNQRCKSTKKLIRAINVIILEVCIMIHAQRGKNRVENEVSSNSSSSNKEDEDGSKEQLKFINIEKNEKNKTSQEWKNERMICKDVTK